MKDIKKFITSRSDAKQAFDLVHFADRLEKDKNISGSLILGGAGIDDSVVSVEHFGELNTETRSSVTQLFEDMDRNLRDLGFEEYTSTRGTDGLRVTDNMVVAATLANIAANNETQWKRAQRSMTVAGQSNDPSVFAVKPMFNGPAGSMSVLNEGLENYNEKSTRDFRVISIAYNLEASRQDAFGEALYPTVVVNPTEGGVTQNLTYAAVLKQLYHKTTGALYDTKEVNIVEAFRDPEVLENESTIIVPIANADDSNEAAFVDVADVPNTVVVLEPGGNAETRPLAMGSKFDLIGISNKQQLLAGSLMDLSDTIDPALKLKAVYLKTGGSNPQVVRMVVSAMPTATFQPALIGDSRLANLHFSTSDLVIDGDVQVVQGTVGPELAEFGARNWTLRLSVNVSGSVSLSKGDTWLTATPVSVERLTDDEGTLISTTAGDGLAVVGALGDMTIIGYELDARFTNTNRRQRGDLLQTRTLQFRYPVPMHSPITLPMSTMDESGPGDLAKMLLVATNIRNSNNAVTRLLNYAAQLKAVVSQSGYDRPKFGAVEGAMSVMIRPTYAYSELDLTTAIDGIRSKDRWDDVCAVILDKIKSLLFPMYRESNIEAAFQTVTGNADERPKFIIATDREIANYLMRHGDDRTLGAYLKYDIVSTANKKMDGKIIVVPTRERPVENDILNFGQFYYVPTIVADLPISRNGQVSREIAAVPFNLHVNNIPFMIEIDVAGLPEVMGQSIYQSIIDPSNP